MLFNIVLKSRPFIELKEGDFKIFKIELEFN